MSERTSAELPPSGMRPLTFCGEEVMLFRTASGKPALVSAYCPHMGAHFAHGGTVVGERTIIHSGAVLGADGFGYLTQGGKHRKVPQIGNVIIGEDGLRALETATRIAELVRRGATVA